MSPFVLKMLSDVGKAAAVAVVGTFVSAGADAAIQRFRPKEDIKEDQMETEESSSDEE